MRLGSNRQGADITGTVIGQGVHLEATLLSGGESVRIDGEFVGDVNLSGSLVIGETGSVTGDLRVKYVVIAGRVDGNIECETVVHIAPTALIDGNIITQSLVVDDGGKFNGTCRMVAGNQRQDALPLPDEDVPALNEKY